MTEKKYVINIDFATKSRIHLNSEFFKVDTRCKSRKKNKKYGGWEFYSKEDVQKFLDNTEKLIFAGREITNLSKCNLCAKLKEYDFSDLIEIVPLEMAIYEQVLLEYRIDHEKIKLFLNNVKNDIHNIVRKLHLFIEDKILQKSFADNLWVFDNSISQGSNRITQTKYQQGLMDHGFFSPELERKLDLYNQARDYELPDQKIENKQDEKWYHKLWNSVKKHLNIIDVILGSLASVIPAFGAATEYKETLEYSIENSYA